VQIFRSANEVPVIDGRRGLAIGVFDGVHIGHRKIIRTLTDLVTGSSLTESLAITFDPHPLSLVRPQDAPPLILSLDDRLAELERLGLGAVAVLPFDARLAATPWEQFTEELLVGEMQMGHLVVGYDFHLGRGRAGSAEDMATAGQEHGFKVQVVSPCYLDGQIVSSTRIRRDLAAGRMAEVSRALGRPWRMLGTVSRGTGIGRQLNFPTANLPLDPRDHLVPAVGVYLVRTTVAGQDHWGVMNLGWAPTLKNRYGAEIHLLDYQGDLYGKIMEVKVLEHIREEIRFSGPDELRQNIQNDVIQARRLIAEKFCF
jgi:riboflavin kinase / FMN adenylyltransferase